MVLFSAASRGQWAKPKGAASGLQQSKQERFQREKMEHDLYKMFDPFLLRMERPFSAPQSYRKAATKAWARRPALDESWPLRCLSFSALPRPRSALLRVQYTTSSSARYRHLTIAHPCTAYRPAYPRPPTPARQPQPRDDNASLHTFYEASLAAYSHATHISTRRYQPLL